MFAVPQQSKRQGVHNNALLLVYGLFEGVESVFVRVEEPETSSTELKRLEDIYNMDTSEFLLLKKAGVSPTGDENVDEMWLHMHSINERAKMVSHEHKASLTLKDGSKLGLLIADTFLTRLGGVFLQKPSSDEALWIKPCRAIHTVGCGPLGVLFLDRNYTVLRVEPVVMPNRIIWQKGATSVLEFAVGSPLSVLEKGDKLHIRPRERKENHTAY